MQLKEANFVSIARLVDTIQSRIWSRSPLRDASRKCKNLIKTTTICPFWAFASVIIYTKGFCRAFCQNLRMQALARIARFRVPQSRLQRGVSWSRLIRDQNAAALAPDEDEAEKLSSESVFFSQQECTAVNGWDCVVLGESPRGPPWILVQGEDDPLCRTQAWKKRNTLRAVGPPFTFTRCDKPDRSELRQQPSGRKMMQALGLEQFLETPIPEFDPELCNAFISSYAPPYGYGIVEGRPVKITVPAIAKLTKLPLGSWKFLGHMKGNRIAILQGMLPTLEAKKPRLYSLEELRFGGGEAESEAFVAVAGLLMERLICKPHPLKSAMGPLLLAMHGSLRLKMQMQWPRLLVSRMRKAAEHAKMDNTPFFYGEWLSGLIRQELSGDRTDELEVEAAAAARCNLESSLKDLARMEMDKAVLDAKLQGR